MFAPGYFAGQHFAPQHFPPVVEFEIEPSGGLDGGSINVRAIVRQSQEAIRRRDEAEARLEEAEKRLSAKAKRRLTAGVDPERIDFDVLEQAILAEVLELPPRRRVVDPPIERRDIVQPEPFTDDDLNLRLLLLLGV